MIELSSAGANSWTSGYAGDTFNTLWVMRALASASTQVDYVTAFGDDPFSERQKLFFAEHGIGTASSPTISGARPGLYAITLNGFERSFTYWRNDAAARLLAADGDDLKSSLAGANLVYFSGITLAILSAEDRKLLLKEVMRARQSGALIAFDPNFRERLWPTHEVARSTFAEVCGLIDIALPTFDDERKLHGDPDPQRTIERYRSAGVCEVAVKCGHDPAYFLRNGQLGSVPAEFVASPVDTTGAGDAFNGGYLSERMAGGNAAACCAKGHSTAAVVIQHRGALAPWQALSMQSSSP